MYTYQNALSEKHTIKCKGIAPEWRNQDCPDILRKDGTRAIEITFPYYEAVVYAESEQERELLVNWLLLNGFTKDKIFE